MRSSYKEHCYDKLFEAMMHIHKPAVAVECGVLDGFSLLAMAEVAKTYGGEVYGVDLFEDYEYKHGSREEICKQIRARGLDNTTLVKEDAVKAANLFEDDTVDLLHIDISNTGDRLKNVFKVWYPKLKKDGILLFEGGSLERDEIEWMKKHEETPIAFFKHILQESKRFEVLTLLPFPSLTICRKRI